MRRLRVLLSAFAFSPNGGSEAGVGWNVATRLARYHDVTVLCGDLGSGSPTATALARYFETHSPIEGLAVQYVSPTRLTAVLTDLHGKPGFWALYYAAYRAWQCEAFHAALRLHERQPFDIAHQLTYCTYREPGYLWRLPIPFFWGPIAGATNVPLSFAGILGLHGSVRFGSRQVGNFLQSRFSRHTRRAAQRARLVWACTEAERRLVERWGGRAELAREVGTSSVAAHAKVRTLGAPLQVVWSGNHVPGKALPLALRAVAAIRARIPIVMDVLGAGPETDRCRALADRHGLGAETVLWRGRLPRPDALRVMQNADVLLHSSLKEATSSVVLEALSFGLPVVCHDACGMGVAVIDNCGIKVPLRNPETSIAGFSEALARLANDPQFYARLSAGALARAEEFTWSHHIEGFNEAYGEAAREAGSGADTGCVCDPRRARVPLSGR